MKASLCMIAVLLFLLPASVSAQSTFGLAAGVHSEGGLLRPGAQVMLSGTRPTGLQSIHVRGELFGSISQGMQNGFSVSPGESGGWDGASKVLGIGAGLQFERKSDALHPYLYAGPTMSYRSQGALGTSLDLGLSGGVGLATKIGEREWFTELSWRGHGDRFDDTALGAFSVGIRF